MKNIVLAIVLTLATLVSGELWAGWRHVPAPVDGYWLLVNDNGEHDGWYYTRRWHCGKWQYYYAYRVNNGVTFNGSSVNGDFSIKYSKTWKEDLVKAQERVKLKQLDLQEIPLFIEAVNAAGLQVDPTSLPFGAMGGYGGYGPGYGYDYSSVSVVNQGATAYGNVSAAGYQAPDWAAYYRMANNFQNRAYDSLQASHEGATQLQAQASADQVDLQKYVAAINGINAAAQATVTPRTVETRTSATPSAVSVQSTQSSYQIQGTLALNVVRGDSVIANSCLKCHGENTKSNLDFTQISSWTPSDRAERANKVWERLNSLDPDKLMPPPSEGHTLSLEDKVAVDTAIRTPH